MIAQSDNLPLVSILTPAYNAERFIAQAIESCKAQTYANWEAIVVDDGSTDNTAAIARACDLDTRIRVVTIPHSGYAKAFNHALSLAEGGYIARLDADDMQRPERLAACVEFLESHPKIGIVTCEAAVIDEYGKTIMPSRNSGRMRTNDYICGRQGAHPANPSIIARQEVYQEVGGFNESMPQAADAEWNMRVILAGYDCWGHIPKPLYLYRIHTGSMTTADDGAQEQQRIFAELVRQYAPQYQEAAYG